MDADQIAELMVDLFTRLVQDGLSNHDTQTGLDPDLQDVLAMHYLKQTKDAVATLERELLATTTLDYTTLGAALGVSKQAARTRVATAKRAQAEVESHPSAPEFRPATLEWAAKHLPPVAHRVRTSIANPRLTAAVDPYADLPERIPQPAQVVTEIGRGTRRLRIATDRPAAEGDSPAG